MLKGKVDFSRIGGYNSGNHKYSSLLYVSSERIQLRYAATNILKPIHYPNPLKTVIEPPKRKTFEKLFLKSPPRKRGFYFAKNSHYLIENM